jgi:hypothetical protein
VHTVLEPLSAGNEILYGDKNLANMQFFLQKFFKKIKNNTTLTAQNILV